MRWKEIQSKIFRLRLEAAEAVKAELPVGIVVAYYHGKRACYAEVIGYDGHLIERVEVVGIPSGKTYWLGVYRIISMHITPSEGKER